MLYIYNYKLEAVFMLYDILIISGFGLFAILVIVIVRFVLILHKRINTIADELMTIAKNINTSLNSIADNIVVVRSSVEVTLSKLNVVLDTLPDTIDNVNTNLIPPLKQIVDTTTAPINSVKRYTSAIGQFISAFRNKLRSNKHGQNNLE